METFAEQQPSGGRVPMGLITISDIKRKVANNFGLEVKDLESKARARRVVRPRQIAIYLVKTLIPHRSYPEIGRHFGGRDHSTAIHSFKLIEGLLERASEKERELREQTMAIIQHFVGDQGSAAQLILPFEEANIFFELHWSAGGAANTVAASPPEENAEINSRQLEFSFVKMRMRLSEPALPASSTSAKPAAPRSVPAKSVTFPREDIIKAVAGFYDVCPKQLEHPSDDAGLKFCLRVADRLEWRLVNNGKDRFVSGRDDLRDDVNVLYRKLTDPGYFPLV